MNELIDKIICFQNQITALNKNDSQVRRKLNVNA